jgi:hypothetical protein
MELHVTETLEDSFNPKNSFDQIPENSFSTKVVKKGKGLNKVKFNEPIVPMVNQPIKPIPKQYAKMTRPNIPSFKPTLSYDDILSKMGMCVHDGKLHLMGNGEQQPPLVQPLKEQQQNNQMPQNNYIYNKYFKDQTVGATTDNRPRNAEEYKNMLIRDILQHHKIKQMKSTKLIMPTSNINVARSSANLNKLFDFSKR